MERDESDAVVRAFAEFMRECVHRVRTEEHDGPWLGETLAEHLGIDPRELPIVELAVSSHQFVNLDIAVQALMDAAGGGSTVGVGGGDQRHHASFADLVQVNYWGRTPVAAVERTDLPVGPDAHRQVVSFGVRMLRFDGEPVAVLQRSARAGHDTRAGIEVMAPAGVAEPLIAQVRNLLVERSVFRGQVLTFGGGDDAFMPSIEGVTFHPRPEVAPAEVILPDGVLDRIERHVLGTGRHADVLRAAGQHLKRGLLLFGPPGTGKTHTVRYLLGQAPTTTAVVLSGTSLHFIEAAAELASALQPALVVLEDVDLVAEDRDFDVGPQPLLFTLLEAIDGLAGDADVAFLLTTNRPDLLEPALAARPGRVDLAVEIPLPDLAGRTELLRLYARDLPLSPAVIDQAARRTDGATASFAKELMRRTTLAAAERGGAPGDADLVAALDDMLADREALTRALFGVGGREALRRERRLRAGFRAYGPFDQGDDLDADDGA